MAPVVTWAEGLSTETVGADLLFWPKTGLNLSEDLFFIWSSPNFGPKTGLNLTEDFFFFGLHLNLGRKTDLVLGWKIFILVHYSQIF